MTLKPEENELFTRVGPGRVPVDVLELLDPWHRAEASFPEGLGTYVYHGGP